MAENDFIDVEKMWKKEDKETTRINTEQDGEMNVTFVLDTSGSMRGARIEQLNFGMTTALSSIQDIAQDKNVDVKVRIIEFNSDADFIMGSAEKGVEIDKAIGKWTDLNEKVASTRTDLALEKALEVMHNTNVGYRNFPPVVILITDGKSDNPQETKAQAQKLKASLKSKQNPDKDMVLVISIGVEDADENELNDVATVGTINEYNSTTGQITSRENVPFAFSIGDVYDLENVLKALSVGSLFSSTSQQADNHFTFDAF